MNDTKKLNIEDRTMIDELKKAKEVLEKDLRKIESMSQSKNDEIIKHDGYIGEKEKEIYEKNKELDKLDKRI